MSTDRSIKTTLGWRFWVAMSLFLLVLWLICSSFIALDQSREKDQRIDALIEGIRQQEEIAAEERLAASKERADLLQYTKALADRQRSLLAYLREEGVDIPLRFLKPLEAPRIVSSPTIAPRRHLKPRRPSSSPPVADTPGKSNPPAKGKPASPPKGRR